MQKSLSAHLDGFLTEAEHRAVVSHLGECPECAAGLARLANLRAALGGLPPAVPPPELSSRLRVVASHERARHLARRRPLHHYGERLRLWADNLMRPLALPFAGGLVSALVLFAMLMPGIALRLDPRVNDVPVALLTGPTVKAQTPFGFHDDDFVLEIIVDREGRMVDYTVMQGAHLQTDPQLRRSIENNLLFTQFTPATFFGKPTFGRMYLSFSRRQINIQS